MSLEKRYAIVIGINDYDKAPLDFCVNDALSIERILIERCRFDPQNIFTLTSNKDNPITEIAGKYKEALRSIKENFNETEDSILFYFAGHGNLKEEKSNIFFHDSEYPIIEIHDEIASLNPKVRTLIIDSCNSGGKVLTRSQEPFLTQEQLIGKYIDTTEGAMLLCACGSEQTARESSVMEHGLLTYEFLNVLNNDKLYDKDGILTPSIIQDSVLKQTLKSSKFEQIPVVENRIEGIYPFATIELNKDKDLELDDSEKLTETIRLEKKTEKKNNVFSEMKEDISLYSKESRRSLQEQIHESLSKQLNDVVTRFVDENSHYEAEEYDDINILDFEKIDDLYKELVLNANEQNISPLNNIFATEKRRRNFYSTSVSSIFKVFRPSRIEDSEYLEVYKINTRDSYISTKVKVLYSNDILSTSFGLGFLVYQSKWGIIVTTFIFKVDWNGEKDDVVKNIKQKNYSFIMNEDTVDLVNKVNFNHFLLLDSVPIWNKDRKTEVKNFIKNSITDK